MKVADFDFDLPKELIAQYPTAERTASRLLCLNKNIGTILHKQFLDLPTMLRPDDLLVFNDTRVIPARLFGNKATGGKVEVLIERVLNDHEALAHVRASKAPRLGACLFLGQTIEAEVVTREHDLFRLRFLNATNVFELLEHEGKVPLPPYIERAPKEADKERYQTVYCKTKGAVAAPTAGLHFDQKILQKITAVGVDCAYLTLHVGAGTFQPVRVDNVLEHHMHAEYVEINQHACEQIKATKEQGGRIIAVGTTVVRSLESACVNGVLQPFAGETDIFIYPGFKFQCVDALITNFHLPKSTLLMLVAAFAGFDNIMHAYKEAVGLEYRFFSYGDAMFIS